MTHTHLKPCPFCGAEALLTEHEAHDHSAALVAITGIPAKHPGSWTIECVVCSCGMIHATRDEVVAAWNNRALLSASIADTATHKLVPHEPTKEMLEAGREQWERIGYASDVWQAMYCAAPTPERADEYCAHEWEEMREPHKECVKCGEVRRDWKSKRGAGTCFRCGHISHSGPCVNVSPERADAELTPDRICQIAYMHSSDDDEPLFRFGHRELLEFVAAVKELSK